jgi:MFS family permease
MLDVVVVAFEALAVATVAPRVARDLGGLDLYGWTFAAFMLANLVSVVISGHAADRHGPAPPFAAGLLLFTSGLLVCGLAPTMPVLVLGRAIQGLGAGALLATAYVAIGRAYDEHERPRQFALLSTAWVVPGLVAPGLAGVIAEQFGWRFVFLGLAGLPLLAAWLSLPQMRLLGPSGRESGALPIRAALSLAGGAGLVVGGLGANTFLVGAPLVALGVALGVPAFRKLTPPGTVRARRGLPAAIATRGLETFAFFGADAFLALTLASVRGLSPIDVGIVLTPSTLTWTCGSWLQARRSGRWSRRAMTTAGVALVAGGIVAASAVLIPEVPVWVAAVAWGIAGLGMGLSYSTTAVTVLSEADSAGQPGAATAALQLSDVLGQALGTGIAGAIVAVALSSGWARRDALVIVFAVMVVVAALSVAAARRFPPDPKRLSEAVPSEPAVDQPLSGHTLISRADGADEEPTR